MSIIPRSSLERRIIDHASEHYPLTADELARALHVSTGNLMVALRRMRSRGQIELDVLPDKVFVRVLVAAPTSR